MTTRSAEKLSLHRSRWSGLLSALLVTAACGGSPPPPDPVPAPAAGQKSVPAGAARPSAGDFTAAATVTPTVALTLSPNPSLYGQAVTMTATVTGSSGTPTGTVTFLEGASTVGTATLGPAGVASIVTNTLAVGSHSVRASYGGNATYFAASSAITSQTIARASATLTTTTNLSVAVYGQAVTLTATIAPVAPSTLVPTGSITFYDGATVLCASAPISAGGVATCLAGSLSVGTHLVSSRYAGTAGFFPVNSTQITVRVDRALTLSTLTVSPAAIDYGQSVAMSALVSPVSPGAGVPGGTVTFNEAGAAIPGCTGVALTSGAASCSTVALTGGSRALTVTYAGDTNFRTSTSAARTVVVSKVAPSAALTSSLTTSAYGAGVTFTATLTGPAGTAPASGSVVFTADGATRCTSALSGGVATCTVSNLLPGDHAIHAAYAGDVSYLAAAADLTQSVVRSAPAMAVTGAPAPSVFGQPVLLTAAVSGAGVTPTGTVTILVGGVPACGPVALGPTGTASCPAGALAVGDHALAATYSGDANYLAASGVGLQDVDRAATILALTASAATAVSGEPVTLTAAVTPVAPGAGLPTGPVEFFDGPFSIGTGDLDPVTGVATLTTGALSVGEHLLNASYVGDPGFQGAVSPDAVALTVDQAATTVAATSSAPVAVFGQDVTITFTVAPAAPSAGVPSGDLVVSVDAGAPVVLTLAGGAATLSLPAGRVGAFLLSFSYPGDGAFLPSDGAFNQEVTRASTALALSASAATTVFGEPVTFTATVAPVAPGAGLPTGSVEFFTGPFSIGIGALDPATGVATLTTDALSVGAHALTASYAGDPSFLGATGAAAVDVGQATPAVSLVSSSQTSAYGEPVTFTVALTGPPGAPAPSGTVTFSADGQAICTEPLSAGAATCTVSELPPGGHGISISYEGDGGYRAAAAAFTQVVVEATPLVSVAGAPAPSVFGQPVILTAAVSGAGATPTGTVTILVGGVPACGPVALGPTGSASCPAGALAAGDHALSAAYSGDANYLAAAGSGLHAVARALTELALAASATATVTGEAVTLTAAVTPVAPGAGLPTGSVEFFDGPFSIGLGDLDPVTGVATLTTGALSVGPHALTAAYAGDPSFQGAMSPDDATLTVALAGTTVAATSSSPTAVFGQDVTVTFTVTPVAPGAGVPSGELAVSLDGAAPMALTLVGGAATLSLPASRVGTTLLTFSYSGDGAFLPSDGALTQEVTRASTTLALATTSAAAVYGEPITLTATVAPVAPGAGLPTGSVEFFTGPFSIGIGALDPATGVATLTTASLSVGAHALTASYAGDPSFLGASGAAAVDVAGAASRLDLAASSSAPAFGAPVSLVAAATPIAPGAGVPEGEVTFLDGGLPIATVALSGGVAAFSTASLEPGPHTLSASYAGGAGFLASVSAPAAVSVHAAPVDVALALAADTTAFGEPLGFSLQVTALGGSAATPAGDVTLSDGATLLQTVTLGPDGRFAGTVTGLSAGPHALQAAFVASARFAGGLSPVQPHAVARGVTELVVSAAPSPSTSGEEVTFTARASAVFPSSGVPTGLVTFLDGGVVLGAAALDASGVASLTASALAAGDHAIMAVYGGDAGYEGTSAAFTHVVQKAPTSATTTVSPAVAVFGQAVTLTVQVASTSGTPGGAVTFHDGAAALGSATLSAGQASLTTSALAVGAHDVVATYAGDDEHLASTAAAAAVRVDRAPTELAVVASPAGTVYGQALTLTASVSVPSPGAGQPAGAVTFLDGGSAIPGCAAVALASGTATCTTAGLTASPHVLTAAYAGDASFAPASSAEAPHTVSPAEVAVTLTPRPASSAFGQAVVLEVAVAAVAPGAGTPSGSVVISDGAAVLGTAALAGGAATFTAGALTVGDHTLRAAYAGDTSFLAGEATAAVAVGRATTTTTLAAAPAASQFGQAVRLTATVAVSGAGGGVPAGSVTFQDGAATLGTVPLDASGVATLDVSTLAVGTHQPVASYAGDATHAGSSGSTEVVVARGAAAVQVAASPNPAAFGQPVTASVTLTSTLPATGTPEGQVIVLDGDAVVCSGPAAAGAFSCTLDRPAVGDHALTVSYEGGATFAAATGAGAFTVEPATAALALASSRNPSHRGRDVTFTATASAEGVTPAGPVTFSADGVVLGTADLVDGVATLTDRSLTKRATPYRITADLAATTEFTAASAVLDGGQVVENSPPVAGAGTALAFGPDAASGAALQLGAALGAGPLTLEAWVRPAWNAPAEAGPAPTVLALGSALSLGISPDRTKVTFAVGGTSREVAAPVDDQAWHHLALVADAGTVSLYVDGLLADTVEAAVSDARAALSVGAGLVGEVDELRAWTVARTPAQLRADARTATPAAADGLAGLWHLDEGAGTELFDAGAAHLDGDVTLAAAGAAAFVPSTAWRLHEVRQERALAPAFDAGYDLDGDALTLEISQAAAHGAASVDQAALQVGYAAGDGFLGADAFTFRLSDGEAASTYELTLEVTRILTCQVTADCGGADLCHLGVCTAPADMPAEPSSGCGCTSGAGSAAALWGLLALGLLRRRRRAA